MYISYKDICIRNAEVKDCAQLATWWNDGSVMAHAGFPLGLNTNAERIAGQIVTDTDDTRRRLIIEYKDQPIGETSYRIVDDMTAEIGIKICEPQYQEKGLGRVILSLLIKQLFTNGCEKIILDTNIKNLRAQHVYELLGFQKVKINVDSWKDQLGEWQSSVDYELVPETFHDYTEKGVNEMVKLINTAEEKRSIARQVLEALTEWFEVPETREDYIQKSGDWIMVASFDEDVPNGFLCLKETGKDTIELAVMGVLKNYHRQGIGTQLFDAAKQIAVEQGYSFMQVKTVAMGYYEDYDQTNRFYQSLGFKELEVFPLYWDEANPCQIYVMAL